METSYFRGMKISLSDKMSSSVPKKTPSIFCSPKLRAVHTEI
jgi:hypothetical protein